MVSAVQPSPPANSDEAAVAAIAQQTETAVSVVRSLYDEEIAALTQRAKVKSFIGVIATRRVKHQLQAKARQRH